MDFSRFVHESLLGDAPCSIVTTNGAKLSNRFSKKCEGCQRRLKLSQKSVVRTNVHSILKRRKPRLHFQQKLTDLKHRVEDLEAVLAGASSARAKHLALMKELLDDVTAMATQVAYPPEPQKVQTRDPEDKIESFKRPRVEKPSPTEVKID